MLQRGSVIDSGGTPSRRPQPTAAAGLVTLAAALVLMVAGCATSKWVEVRSVPRNPLVDELKLTSWGGPEPTKRTMQVLRVWNLTDDLQGDPQPLLAKLQAIADRDPSAEKVYAMSELAYLGAKEEERHDPRRALDLYGASVLHAYHYLFDPRFAALRNPYDPQFRGACELYNSALESALRIVCEGKELVPGKTKTIETAAGKWDITCVLRGGQWRPEEFERFEFVSDYEMKGLKNHYQTRGLGVPLIAVRKRYPGEPAVARYYPAGLSFPVTAFLRPVAGIDPRSAMPAPRRQGLLELYDPLMTTETAVADTWVKLESDLTTPLACFLSRVPLESLATTGLLRPDKLLALRPGGATPIKGLYMVQPYEQGKIPVLLVHGLWSSPMTWMEMFNDLRSSPDIRAHYQFWFYLYPTGQPFWISAAQLRQDLAEVRQVVDPQRAEPSLDQIVLVGHSMGGLVSRLQTVDSRNEFWNLASRSPLEEVKAEPEVKQRLHDTFFFHPNPSVRRVVTIGTPHRGSHFSNQTTQYLLGKLIRLPELLVNSRQKLFRDNPGLFDDHSLLRIDTSIDSLAPDATVFSVLLSAPRAPWVTYHNIVGQVPKKWWMGSWADGTDGVVTQKSAHVDDAVSQVVVPADHTTVHCHPAAVLEVRRILLDHLNELRHAAAHRMLSARCY